MRVIKTQNYNIYGNDCMIYKTVHLIENIKDYEKMYTLQIDTKVEGWCESKDSNTYKLKTKKYKDINTEIEDILQREYDFNNNHKFKIDNDDLR